MKTKNPTLSKAETRADYGHKVSIVNLFLNIYKFQLGVPKLAVAEVVPIDSASSGPDYVYELRIKQRGNKWESRRMSVAMIGETVSSKTRGSKSICFKVIYDTLIVVKIPPFPIKSFREYMKSIQAETRIAAKLEPHVEFVAPGVSAILKKIHMFSGVSDLTSTELEKYYIKWLEEHPEFQEYLKIGDAFIFFMDLSQHSFLSYVVERMHDPALLQHKIQDEIIKSHELLWDILGFEGKYGSENLSVCFNINKIYSDYESEIRQLLKQYSIHSMSSYERQEWFLLHLSGKKIENNKNISPAFVEDANELLKNIIKANKEDVKAYRKAVGKYIHKMIFVQNKIKIVWIISNIINLLFWLQKRELAIRDLKPDNLFVVGDSEKHPLYLSSSEESSLGLIDFETSVELRAADDGKIPQPLLGGTPSYSTPSNLFPNDVLNRTLGDVGYILHLQDWYAAVTMIYQVITGESLFDRTRKILGRIKYMARKAVMEKQSLAEVFKKGSRVFWNSAVIEFKEKLTEKEKNLKSVEMEFPENAGRMLSKNILRQKSEVEKKLRSYVSSQVIFNSDKNRKNLIQSSLEDIREYRKKWEQGVRVPSTPPVARKKIIILLKELERMKYQERQYEQLKNRLDQEDVKFSVYELLEIMFNIVLKSMYKMEWGMLSKTMAYDELDDFPSDGKDDETILYESTILYETKV